MRLQQLQIWRHHKRLAVAVIEDEATVVDTVRRLQRLGIKNDQISLLALDTQKVFGAIAEIGAFQGQDVRPGSSADVVAEETAPKGRSELEGMALGGGIGLLIGLAAFAIPGLGVALLAAGPVVMAINVLGHTAAGGLGLGMVLGAIFDERVTEDHRRDYKERLEAGHWLLVVHGDERDIERAQSDVFGPRVERVEVF